MNEKVKKFWNKHEEHIKIVTTSVLAGVATMGILSTAILLKFASALDNESKRVK
jgi:hypothetical protein